MYSGSAPDHLLMEVTRRQAEVREGIRGEGLARRSLRASRVRRLSVFRIWRLHVMVWVEGARETSRSAPWSARS